MPIFSSPALLHDGSVIFASIDGTVARVDRRGRIRWRTNLGAAVFASPAVRGSRVIIGSDNDMLWCLDLRTGRRLWSTELGPCAVTASIGPESVRCDADASPAVVGNRVYVTADALYVLSLASGRRLLRSPLAAHAMSSPAIGRDGAIYFGTQATLGWSTGSRQLQAASRRSSNKTSGTASASNAIHALDRAGRVRWVYRAGWHCDGTPAVGSQALHVGCDDRTLYSIDLADGKLRWKVTTGGPVRSSPAVSLDGRVLVGSYDGKLYAVGPDGKVVWTYLTGGPIHSSPVVDPSGTVVFGSQDDHVYALDAQGRLLWRVRLGGDVDASVAVGVGGVMAVGADDGNLYLLGP